MADDGGGLVRLDRKADTTENPLNVCRLTQLIFRRAHDARKLLLIQRLIGEPDITKLDAAGAVTGDGIFWRDDLSLRIEQLEDAFTCGHGRLEDVVLLAEVLNGAEEALGVLHEGDDHADADGAEPAVGVHRRTAAQPDDAGDGDRAEQIHGGVVEGVGHDGVFEGVHVLAVHGREITEGALFAVEELHYRHAAHMLLRVGVDVGDGCADAAVGVADVGAEELGGVEGSPEGRRG